jgi:deaminated glutathione amidase
MRIAIVQMTSGIDASRNAAMLEASIEKAAAGNARMVFTPEMSGLIDSNRDRARQTVCREADDRVLQSVRAAAKAHKIWVHLGSTPIKNENDGRFANRGFIVDPSGQVRARYDKIHLFDVDLPTGERWRESAAYISGERAVVAETGIGPVGMGICYDLRFPALFAAQSAAGAQILTVPSAFTVPTGQAHWHVLLRSRAIENACWVVAAAQVGSHEDGRKTFGHSLVIDPWGTVVLDMEQQSDVGFAQIDLSQVDDVRTRIPVISHRRVIPNVEICQ